MCDVRRIGSSLPVNTKSYQEILIAAVSFRARGSFLGNFVFAFALRVAALEPLDPSGGVHDFFLSGEKRMAGAAEFDPDFVASASHLESIAACTDDSGVAIFGMNS